MGRDDESATLVHLAEFDQREVIIARHDEAIGRTHFSAQFRRTDVEIRGKGSEIGRLLSHGRRKSNADRLQANELFQMPDFDDLNRKNSQRISTIDH